MPITSRFHLFPSRTQKLSSIVPKILGWRRPGKIGRCRPFSFFKRDPPSARKHRCKGSNPVARCLLRKSQKRFAMKAPTALSLRPLGQAAKTAPSHGAIVGSIPAGVTKRKRHPQCGCLCIPGLVRIAACPLPLRRPRSFHAPLAQLVEQLTLNQRAQGSSPWRCTKNRQAFTGACRFLYLEISMNFLLQIYFQLLQFQSFHL